MTESCFNLHHLLNLDPKIEENRQRLNGDAIIRQVQKNPHIAEKKYLFLGADEPCYPLHQAIKLRAPINVIKALCSSVALKAVDVNGSNVLHLALSHMASSTDVILLLLEKQLEAIRKKRSYRWSTPLHVACEHHAPVEVVSLLLQSWPDDVLTQKDEFGCTPLHLACEGALREKDNIGSLPLHCACEDQAPLEVLNLLIESWPDGLRQKDESGYTPLHAACRGKASLEIVSLLIDSWSGALREKTNDDSTALNLACLYGAPLEVVSFLVEGWPDALKMKNVSGYTPLHCAFEYETSLELISLLVDGWPGALAERYIDFSNTPLHLACTSGAPLDVTILLLEKLPEATRQKNYLGWTPFDQAKADNAPEETKKVVSCVSSLFDDDITNASAKEIMDFFTNIEWWNGALLLLDRCPSIVQTIKINIKVMPYLLSMIGCRCKMTTIWEVLCNNQDLFKDIL